MRQGSCFGAFHERPGQLSAILLALLCLPLASALRAQSFFPCADQLFADGFQTPPGAEPLCDDGISQHHRLPAPGGLSIWTAASIDLIGPAEPVPAVERTGFMLSAARGESEAIQIALRSDVVLDTAAIAVSGLAGIGGGDQVSLAQVGFDAQGQPATLIPRSSDDPVDLDRSAAAVLWLTFHVPGDAAPGVHTGSIVLTLQSAGTIELPVEVYVYDFLLPADRSLAAITATSFANPSVGLKQTLFDARLAPTNPVWPSGFAANVTWDQTVHPATRCTIFDDESDHETNPEFQLAALASRYLHGVGWNDQGFAESVLFSPVSVANPRPATFCDEPIGASRFGTPAYNVAWQAYLAALAGYLNDNGYLDRGFALLQHEPQSQEDDELAAHLCTLAKAAAPSLRVAVREQPKPEIAELAEHACGYDLWISSLVDLDRDYALQRQSAHFEDLWLDAGFSPPLPFIDPGSAAGPGRATRLAPWLAWVLRARGHYFPVSTKLQEAGSERLTVQAELLREGLEDFEYLRLANAGLPRPGMVEPVDPTAWSVVSSPVAMARDAQSLSQLRHQLGRRIEGRRQSSPTYLAPVRAPRAAHYLNFQNPADQPVANPLVVGGHTWQKVGWDEFDPATGRGWLGNNLGTHGLTGFASDAGFNVLQRSYLYHDLGQIAVYEFGLEPGRYIVRVGVGRPSSNPDPQHLAVESIVLVNDELLATQVERSAEVDVIDGSLTLTMGGLRRWPGAASYTFLAYLSIEPVPD